MISRRVLALVSVLLLLASSFPAKRAESMPGGITEASTKDKWVVDAANFAIKAKQKAMREETKEPHPSLFLVKILGARQQVVAGMNYYVTLRVKLNGTVKTAEVVVWRQLSGEHRLTSWEWK